MGCTEDHNDGNCVDCYDDCGGDGDDDGDADGSVGADLVELEV